MTFKLGFSVVALLASLTMGASARAQAADDFVGYWITEEKDVIIRLARCKRQSFMPEATSICGRVVWDVVAKDPNRKVPSDCNRRLVQFNEFKDGTWEDGWAFNSRDNRSYLAKMRLNDKGQIAARTYVGNEMQGQTLIFNPVMAADVPPDCQGQRPDQIRLR
ncbi:MAG: DUF2147 domain-containing protein [Pseudomonadota bacterium]|nr:DUF2147 domain-containing protein [Pseudomonadota bacterium]